MQGINLIAIDFEAATGKRASICEAGICVVRDGEIVETSPRLVRPQGNSYSYWNMQIHGIWSNDTVNSPEFSEVWTEICEYLKGIPVLVAHNATFDISCIRHSLELYCASCIIFPSVWNINSITSDATVWTISVTRSRYLTGSTTGQAMMRRCAHGCF